MAELPTTMHALLQKGDGYSGVFEGPAITDAAEYLENATIPLPVPMIGQVLIKMRVASINPSDLHFIKGEYGQPRVKGKPAGFEGCGDVVAAGEGATRLIGKRVAFVASPSGSGCWAEYALTDAISCIPLRPDVSDEDGAAQIVNPLTAMAMVAMARKSGDVFALTAATSQLGKLMIGLGRDLGLKTIAFCRRADAVEDLKQHGASEVLVTTDPDLLEQAVSVFKSLKPRVLLDAVSDQLSADLFAAMPNRARWVSYGKLAPELPVLRNMGQFIFMEKQIEGFWLTKWFRDTPPADQMAVVTEVQARFADGRWRTDVSHRLALQDVVAGLDGALKTPNGKVMITFDTNAV